MSYYMHETEEDRARRVASRVSYYRRMVMCASVGSVGILTACLSFGPRVSGLRVFFGVEGVVTAIATAIVAVLISFAEFDV